VGALVSTNIGSNAGSNLAAGQSAVAACQAQGLANCAGIQTTFNAPAGASHSGPIDSYAALDKNGNIVPSNDPNAFKGIPVDFQFINGNLGRNLGLTKGLTDFDISLLKAFRIPKRESMRVELKMDVFNVFNHPNFIGNDSNDSISAIGLSTLEVPVNPKKPSGAQMPNPNFNCAASCVNPFSGLYLGANGAPLTLSVFRAGRPDKNLAAANFSSLGDPAATALGTSAGASRIIQLALRIRW
jgi:hypothetical protein